MKTTEENRNMDPGESRKPGDVYMILTPEGRPQLISTKDTAFHRFDTFLNDYAKFVGTDLTSPNSFIVCYRFDDPAKIPAWKPGEDLREYYPRLDAAIRELGLKPADIRRLYPLLYCQEKGLDPLRLENSQEALSKSMTYQLAALHYSGLERSRENTYTGIQTDRGVLLFDNTERGEKLQEEYKNLFTANFFDPRLDVTFFRTLELIPDEEQKAKVNPALDSLFMPGMGPFVGRSTDAYIDVKDIGIYTESERYDMSPTLDNFTCFTGLDRGEMPDLPGDSYDISCLLYLSSPGCKDPVIQDDFPYYFSYYDRFDPLSDKFAEAATPTEKEAILADIRKLAGETLREKYPNIRRPQTDVPTPKEQVKVAAPAPTTPRQLPDVAGKLAQRSKQSKKKNGLKP